MIEFSQTGLSDVTGIDIFQIIIINFNFKKIDKNNIIRLERNFSDLFAEKYLKKKQTLRCYVIYHLQEQKLD